MSVRDALVAAIRATGTDARVVSVEDNKDELDTITIMVKQRTIRRLPEAPAGSLRIDYVLTITHPATDPAVSEPGLDHFVPELLADLDRHSWIGWSIATKTLDDQNLAYDVECFVVAGPKGD